MRRPKRRIIVRVGKQMKVLLVALNAKYIHSNLAIRYLYHSSKEYKQYLRMKEFTINHSLEYIIRELYKERPDCICLSCYIWNIEMIKDLVREYSLISPRTRFILGGPEVSFDGTGLIEEIPQIDMIIRGEGECSFYQVLDCIVGKKRNIDKIKGIIYSQAGKIRSNQVPSEMSLDALPFPYENELGDYKNRIIYYESSRGCPFQCQYCLSSVNGGVRFRDLQLVIEDLKKLLEAKVRQVKFVDRTFNCNKNHAMGIWKFLIDHSNDYTNFHFEISADLLDEESIDLLKDAPPGLFQFEIGVQSTNEKTLAYIQRKMKFEKVSKIVKKLKKYKNIHLHLDLIAGLPGENYASFKQSFNDVYNIEPEQIQLGFLKVLKGSGIYREQKKYQVQYSLKAPYEVRTTKELSYDEILKLKMIEEMVEVYYNSGRFLNTIRYMILFFDTPFDFYSNLAKYWEEKGCHHIQHNKLQYYSILFHFFQKQINSSTDFLKELMLLDLYTHEKLKKIPQWLDKPMKEEQWELVKNFYHEPENIKEYLPEYLEYTPKQISRMAHIEFFTFDMLEWMNDSSKEPKKTGIGLLFNYKTRCFLDKKKRIIKIYDDAKSVISDS